MVNDVYLPKKTDFDSGKGMNFASRSKKWNSIDRISQRKQSILQTKEEQLINKELFSGFISGSSFRTKKGYIGNQLDSLWIRFLFDSFINDDVELVNIALSSCLVDLTSIERNEDGVLAYPY